MNKSYLNSDNQLNPLLICETGAPMKYGIHCVEDLVSTCISKEMNDYKHPMSKL